MCEGAEGVRRRSSRHLHVRGRATLASLAKQMGTTKLARPSAFTVYNSIGDEEGTHYPAVLVRPAGRTGLRRRGFGAKQSISRRLQRNIQFANPDRVSEHEHRLERRHSRSNRGQCHRRSFGHNRNDRLEYRLCERVDYFKRSDEAPWRVHVLRQEPRPGRFAFHFERSVIDQFCARAGLRLCA